MRRVEKEGVTTSKQPVEATVSVAWHLCDRWLVCLLCRELGGWGDAVKREERGCDHSLLDGKSDRTSFV